MEDSHDSRVTENVELWELELARKVALAFRTEDRAELAAELTRKLAVLKTGDLSHVRDWKAYLAKFLYNKAANWVRDDRARRKRELLAGSREGRSSEPSVLAPDFSDEAGRHNLRMALGSVWAELDPELQRLWQVLLEENGNQVAVGRRLGMHRNAIRLRIGRIKRILQKHGMDSF